MGGAGTIRLEWIGGAPDGPALLDRVRDRVGQAFGRPVQVAAVDGPPPETWDAGRGQQSSTRVLHWILERTPEGSDRVVAVTDADLFIPVLTYVFGEAQVGGRAGVVSTARLARTYDDRPASPGLLELRLLKECLHELGHSFGLVHCPDLGCVMSRSNSVVDIDQKRARFCRDCRLRLRQLLREGDEP